MIKYIKHLSLATLLFLTGCQSILDSYAIKRGYQKKEGVEKEIINIKKEYESKLITNQSNIESKYSEIVEKQNKIAQDANVYVYGITNLIDLKNPKNRIDELIKLKSKSAFGLLPVPTTEQLLAENENIKKELDETKVTLFDLQIKYSQIEKENEEKKQQFDLANEELKKLKNEKNVLENEKNNKIIELQEIRNKYNEQQLAFAADREQKIKDNKELKSKISYGAAGLGAILIIIGIVVLKSPILAMVGGGFIGFSVFIATAPTWLLWTVPGILFLLVGIIIFLKYKKEKLIGDNTVRAIQRFKESAIDTYNEKLKPILVDEHGKYNKNGEVVKDKEVDKEIDKKLIDMNLK